MNLIKVCGINKKFENFTGIDLIGFHFIDGEIYSVDTEFCESMKTPESVLRVGVFGKKDENFNWKYLTKSDLVDIILLAKKTKINALEIHGFCDFSYLKQYNFFTLLHISSYSEMLDVKNEDIDFLLIRDDVFKTLDINTITQPFLVSVTKGTKNLQEQVSNYKKHELYQGLNIENYIR